MAHCYDTFIFDLDGTLVDTSPGIIESLRYTEKAAEVTPLTDEQIRKFVGPPLKWSFMTFHGADDAKADEMVEIYRKYYEETGMKNGYVYPGVVESLEEIRRRGCNLGIATLKYERVAAQTLETFGLDKYIENMIGNDDVFNLTKGQEIDRLLERFRVSDKGRAVMFGDSHYDGIGAMEAGVDFIGLSYGYGFKNAETEAPQFPVAQMLGRPEDLPEFVSASIAEKAGV